MISDLVVDQIVRVVGKERVNAPPRNPCRLWVGQRDFLGGLVPAAAAARTTTVSISTSLIAAGGIESRQVFANRSRRLLRLWPSDRLVARHPLFPAHIRLDQARIDRECFTAYQSGGDAPRHHLLEHSAQGIALAEALVPRTAEHRMIGDFVLDAELAKPPIG